MLRVTVTVVRVRVTVLKGDGDGGKGEGLGGEGGGKGGKGGGKGGKGGGLGGKGGVDRSTPPKGHPSPTKATKGHLAHPRGYPTKGGAGWARGPP